MQYRFSKLLQFSPRGESRVNGDSYDYQEGGGDWFASNSRQCRAHTDTERGELRR